MAEEQPISEYFFPKLEAVEALAPYRLRTTWSTDEVLEVDIEDVLRRFPALLPILDSDVFATVHIPPVSSQPGELPPELLTEPYVTLSRHTALVIEPLRPVYNRRQCAKRPDIL